MRPSRSRIRSACRWSVKRSSGTSYMSILTDPRQSGNIAEWRWMKRMGSSAAARAAIRYLLREGLRPLRPFAPPRPSWTQVNAREIYPGGQINLPRITRPSLSYSLKYFTRTSDRIFPIGPSGRALSISRFLLRRLFRLPAERPFADKRKKRIYIDTVAFFLIVIFESQFKFRVDHSASSFH